MKSFNTANLAESAYRTFLDSGATGNAVISTSMKEIRIDAIIQVSILVEVAPIPTMDFNDVGCTCDFKDDEDDGSLQ